MMGFRKYCLWLISTVACCQCVFAQAPGNEDPNVNGSAADTSHITPPANLKPDTAFTVRQIVLVGNKKTRPEIMLREIPFKPGEQFILQELVKKFEIARKQLMNTTLFHEVIVALKSFDGYNVDVLVQ